MTNDEPQTEAKLPSLEEVLQDAFAPVADLGTEEGIVLSAGNLPQPPAELQTDKVVAVHGVSRIYHPGYTAQGVDIYASRANFRRLGLLALSTLFHPEPAEVTLHLTATPDLSVLGKELVRKIVFRFEHIEEPGPDRLWQTPTSFSYWPKARDKHPWCIYDTPATPWELPWTYVSDAEDLGDPPLDHLYGFGFAEATARFAALLMDMNHKERGSDEHQLECEVGFRGVAPGSLEINLYPPGCICWDCFVDALGLGKS